MKHVCLFTSFAFALSSISMAMAQPRANGAVPPAIRARAARILSSPAAKYLSGSSTSALHGLTTDFVVPSSHELPRMHDSTGQRRSSSGQVMVNDPTTDLLTILDVTMQSETAVASFDDNVVVTYNDSGEYLVTSRLSGYSRSSDGGATFADLGAIPGAPASVTLGDPALVVDRHGVFSYAELVFDPTRPPGFESTVGVSRSTDGGQTFGDKVYPPADGVPPDSFQDKEFLAVDTSDSPFAGNLYLTWTNFPATPTELPIMFSRSTDGGASFSTPVAISPPGDLNQDSEPAVGPHGEVYVTWLRYPPIFPLDPAAILVAKSTDGGAHFGTPVVVTPVPLIGFVGGTLFGNFRVDSAPRIDVDPVTSNVCIVFAGNPPGLDGADIFFTRSTDGGGHWSDPIRVNDDSTFNDQFMPDLAISKDGIVEVIWYDRRLDPNNLKLDVFRARSVNGGQSFRPNQRVTSASSFPAVGFDPLVVSTYMGDYIDIKTTINSHGRGKDFVLAWGDFRRIISTPRGNRPDQDVFFTRIKP